MGDLNADYCTGFPTTRDSRHLRSRIRSFYFFLHILWRSESDHYQRWVNFEIFGEKNYWLSYLNECPELLCGLSCNQSWDQTFPMENSPCREKRILRGITIILGPQILWIVRWPGGNCSLTRGKVLVFINRHNPTMNLVEEKQRGSIPLGPQGWPLQLIEHLANTTSVVLPPACPAGLPSSVPSLLVESEFYNMGSK